MALSQNGLLWVVLMWGDENMYICQIEFNFNSRIFNTGRVTFNKICEYSILKKFYFAKISYYMYSSSQF